jgi:hypothetical protein
MVGGFPKLITSIRVPILSVPPLTGSVDLFSSFVDAGSEELFPLVPLFEQPANAKMETRSKLNICQNILFIKIGPPCQFTYFPHFMHSDVKIASPLSRNRALNEVLTDVTVKCIFVYGYTVYENMKLIL